MGIGKSTYRRDLHSCGKMFKRSKMDDYRELPTRQFNKIVLKVPEVLLTKSFNSSMYKGAKLWNALPQIVQSCPTYKEFKYRYRQMGKEHPQ